jgi:hypothetical protein
MVFSLTSGLDIESVMLLDVVSEHEGGDGSEFDQDVDGWA